MTNEPEGTNFQCGVFVLIIAFVLGVGLVALLLYFDTSVQVIEKWMVWTSVPWFAFWYLKCRKWHRTKIRFVDKDEESK